jgi:hypothetical protein
MIISPYAKSVLVASGPKEAMWSEVEDNVLEPDSDPEDDG